MKERLAKDPRVKLYFLPCYNPQFNPVEKIWWLLKAAVTTNKLYNLIDALMDAVIALLDNLTSAEIQTLTAKNDQILLQSYLVEDTLYSPIYMNDLIANTQRD